MKKKNNTLQETKFNNINLTASQTMTFKNSVTRTKLIGAVKLIKPQKVLSALAQDDEFYEHTSNSSQEEDFIPKLKDDLQELPASL